MYLKIFKSVFLCFIIIVLFSMVSCGISKDEMQRGIIEKQQETFDTNPDYKEFGLIVQDVTLLKTGSNTYDGLMTVLFENEKFNVSLSIKTDSNTYMWEWDPNPLFNFIRQRTRNIR